MNTGRTVFSQIMDFLPLWDFRKCVKRYRGNHKIQKFSCLDQFLCMAFAQLTYRESLRDIEVCLRAMQTRLYHMGIRSRISKSTLADANEHRDWRIYGDFAQVLIHMARELYIEEEFAVELDQTVYALDSTTIDLCLSLFPWAKFRKHKAGIKLHTLLDLRGNIPTFIHVTEALRHDVNILDDLLLEAGAFYIMDRRVCYEDKETEQTLVFLTNCFTLSATTIAQLYKCRWQLELFFKWIKQHLRIKAFFGTTKNAVKTQIWIAISVYVLVAIIKKQLNLDLSLYTILQILSVTLFEKVSILQVLTEAGYKTDVVDSCNRLMLFDL